MENVPTPNRVQVASCPVSVVIITRDAAKHLPAVLAAVAFCDERLVLDSDRLIRPLTSRGLPAPGLNISPFSATASKSAVGSRSQETIGSFRSMPTRSSTRRHVPPCFGSTSAI
jgi:hypothetical protein